MGFIFQNNIICSNSIQTICFFLFVLKRPQIIWMWTLHKPLLHNIIDLVVIAEKEAICTGINQKYIVIGVRKKKMYLKNVKCSGEGKNNCCLNTLMNGTAFFLPCHSGSIFSEWNLEFGQDKMCVSSSEPGQMMFVKYTYVFLPWV